MKRILRITVFGISLVSALALVQCKSASKSSNAPKEETNTTPENVGEQIKSAASEANSSDFCQQNPNDPSCVAASTISKTPEDKVTSSVTDPGLSDAIDQTTTTPGSDEPTKGKSTNWAVVGIGGLFTLVIAGGLAYGAYSKYTSALTEYNAGRKQAKYVLYYGASNKNYATINDTEKLRIDNMFEHVEKLQVSKSGSPERTSALQKIVTEIEIGNATLRDYQNILLIHDRINSGTSQNAMSNAAENTMIEMQNKVNNTKSTVLSDQSVLQKANQRLSNAKPELTKAAKGSTPKGKYAVVGGLSALAVGALIAGALGTTYAAGGFGLAGETNVDPAIAKFNQRVANAVCSVNHLSVCPR